MDPIICLYNGSEMRCLAAIQKALANSPDCVKGQGNSRIAVIRAKDQRLGQEQYRGKKEN